MVAIPAIVKALRDKRCKFSCEISLIRSLYVSSD